MAGERPGGRDSEARIERLRPLLRRAGLALTAQRRAILHAVFDHDEHPTADRVYAILKQRRIPASRATVFRTLEALARLGVVSKASHPGVAVRYDGRSERHHHLVCVRCDRIVDFADEALDAVSVPDTRRLGFRVLDLQVELRGICRLCREQEDRT